VRFKLWELDFSGGTLQRGFQLDLLQLACIEFVVAQRHEWVLRGGCAGSDESIYRYACSSLVDVGSRDCLIAEEDGICRFCAYRFEGFLASMVLAVATLALKFAS
jgi:hypothetical protein